jgi:hypothetical protein
MSDASRALIFGETLLSGLEYAALLSDAGFNVIGVTDSVKDAVRAATKEKPDLVVAGLGRQWRRTLRQLQAIDGAPFLFVQDGDGASGPAPCRSVPRAFCLARPFAPRQFQEVAEELASGPALTTVLPGGRAEAKRSRPSKEKPQPRKRTAH